MQLATTMGGIRQRGPNTSNTTDRESLLARKTLHQLGLAAMSCTELAAAQAIQSEGITQEPVSLVEHGPLTMAQHIQIGLSAIHREPAGRHALLCEALMGSTAVQQQIQV